MESLPANPPKTKKPFYKKWWFWVIVIIVGFVILLELGSRSRSNPDDSDLEERLKPKYETVEVAGMPIREACAAMKEKGWQDISVRGLFGNWLVRDSDCNDEHIAKSASYYSDSVELVFEIDNESDLTDSERAKYNSLEGKPSDSDKNDGTSSSNNNSDKANSNSNASNSSSNDTTKPVETTVKEYTDADMNNVQEIEDLFNRCADELEASASKTAYWEDGLKFRITYTGSTMTKGEMAGKYFSGQYTQKIFNATCIYENGKTSISGL